MLTLIRLNDYLPKPAYMPVKEHRQWAVYDNENLEIKYRGKFYDCTVYIRTRMMEDELNNETS